MNRLLFALFFCWVSLSVAIAQKTDYKNSIRIGTEYMILGTPEDVGMRYLTRYDRYLSRDRLMLEVSLGYLSAPGPRSVFSDGGKHRQRITGELSLLYDLLKSPTHALRLGVGPSVWNRQDDVRGIDSQFHAVNETNIGAHAVIEYEYRLTSKFIVSGRYGVTYFDIPGPSSMVGMNVGYQF